MNNMNKLEVYKELQKELDDRKKKQRFYTEDFITIDYDQQQHWLYADWIGYQTEGSVMAGCEKMLEALVQFKVTRILNDNTRVLGIWTPAAVWVGADWFPRMKAAGLKHFAWVYSPSILSQVSTNESIKSTPLPDIINTFYNIEEAREWLKAINP